MDYILFKECISHIEFNNVQNTDENTVSFQLYRKKETEMKERNVYVLSIWALCDHRILEMWYNAALQRHPNLK